jgi:SAM-dependent methyltransferase
MTSDWRVLPETLNRASCLSCGLGVRGASDTAHRALYDSGYSLYAHAPGESRERARQSEYAGWIAAHLSRAPRRVLDVGCGNGSLLRAFQEHWPRAEMLGCDPSEESIAAGTDGDVRLWQGTADTLPSGLDVDAIVSVNVLEHTRDPRAFVGSLMRALSPDGVLVIVCPDGARPGVELLFADHLFSFTRAHLMWLVRTQSLRTLSVATAPASLGAFQLLAAARGAERQPAFEGADALAAGRTRYLERWRRLDGHLRARIGGPAVCFGASEAAGLLRAYAPATWSVVRACTFDGASGGRFGTVPIVPFEEVSAGEALLVGVRPRDQAMMASRLGARFSRVVTWYDLVDEELEP